MGQRCDHCINKTQCAECNPGWKDKFIPSDEVKGYFKRHYVGASLGINEGVYFFDNLSKKLKPTHAIQIGYKFYCPYCGHEMYAIQVDKGRTLPVTGYTCICKGARNEIEYEAKLEALKEKHKKEISELNCEYADKLTFCADKLLEIKHAKEKQNVEYYGNGYTHMSLLNGKKYTDIEQIARL